MKEETEGWEDRNVCGYIFNAMSGFGFRLLIVANKCGCLLQLEVQRFCLRGFVFVFLCVCVCSCVCVCVCV